jgi:hypothetical protein
MKMKFSIKDLAIGLLLGTAGVALAATVTTPYLSGGTAMTSGHAVMATSDGFGIQDSGVAIASLNKVVYPLSWTAGMNLATNDIPMGFTGLAATAQAAVCVPEVLAGGAATIDIYYAPSGTACTSGTKINTNACNANTGATTEFNMGVTNSSIPINSTICAHATGFGTTNGSGVVQLTVTQ